jgi:peptide/nickel transport system substrate-binding protein
MDALVASGDLPPVEERLPNEPQVFLASGMSTGLGEYGGVWRDFSACPTEGWNLGAGQTQGWFGINIIYQEALVKTGPIWMRSDNVEPFPNLAKSWEWSDDGMELTMHLIEGAKWSDGEAFNSEDVMFTWEHLILDPNVGHPTSRSTWQVNGEDVSLEALDEYTIKWTFPVAFPVQLLYSMDDYDFYVAPEHVWAPLHPAFNADADYDSFRNAQPADDLPAVTLGPWVAVEYKTDEFMVLRRNPYYWKVDESGKQLPYLDEVTFQKGTDGIGRTLNTMAGSGDHSNLENPSVFIETLKREAEPDAHFSVEWGPETLAFGLELNQSATFGVQDERDAALRELFRDVRFRRALSQAIDRDGVAQAVVRGPFLRAWPGGLYPGSPYYSRDSVVFYPYSPDTSRALLADMGFEDTDGNGVLNWPADSTQAGEELVISLRSSEDASETGNIAEALVTLFGDIGIQINHRPAAGTIGTAQNESGEWEMAVFRGGQAYAVPFTYATSLAPITDQTPNWHRKGAEDRQLQPFEQELVDIVTEFRLEPDSTKRIALMAEYNRIFTENIYNIGVVIGRYGLALATRFENVPVGSPVFLYQWTWGNVQPDQVWVKPENQLPEIYPGTVPVYGE